MERQKLNIKLLGGLVAICGMAHLLLNLFITTLPLILKPDELQSFMRSLAQMFGPIAIQEDRNSTVLFIKVIVSALFLSSGIGVIRLKEWFRKLLICLLGLRIIYGMVVCAVHRFFHPHLIIIITAGLVLFYYLTRPKVKRAFKA